MTFNPRVSGSMPPFMEAGSRFTSGSPVSRHGWKAALKKFRIFKLKASMGVVMVIMVIIIVRAR